MNNTITKNQETEKKDTLNLKADAGSYRIEWRKGEASGRRAEPYGSFIGAVRSAEAMQETAKTHGIGMTFSVIDSGNQTVFIC